MNSFYFLLGLIIVAIIIAVIEFYLHQKRIYAIPIRIHINGTRGKSSVTRLIAAGLRQGGISTITKVTGTFPRLILEDGSETIIHRKADANIIEQLSIVKFATARKVKALVIECMALQPQYQWITEHQMIHSNISVMTNVRMDHTDIMGHSLREIADTMCRTIPRKEHVFSAENHIPEVIREKAEKLGTVAHFVDETKVSQEEMAGFSYIEHRENVALALAVCAHAGVDRSTAIRGMYQAVPDAGVLRRYQLKFDGKTLDFYNAFAANDPDSTLMVWKKIKKEIGFNGLKFILLNTRNDRLERAQQLVEMVAEKLAEETDLFILIGQSTEVVEHKCIHTGFPKNKILNLGWTTPEDVFEAIISKTNEVSTTIAIGNMGGMGASTVEYFKQRSMETI